jgi:sporulation protein YlmC with PRC-barrel domain
LMATSAAILLTTGVATAQSTTGARQDSTPLTPSPSAPGSASGGVRADGSNIGNSAAGNVSPGGSTSGDMSGSTSSSSDLSAASLREIDDDTTIVSSFDMNVKKLKGMDIVGSDGKKIGEIDKVLADGSNQPKAVTVDAGGFLGIGSKEVIVSLDQLQKGTDDNFRVAMTKEQVENLQRWEAKRDAGPADRGVATGAGGQPATTIPPR